MTTPDPSVLDKAVNFINNDAMTALGVSASIASLVVSGFVWWGVRNIRKFYIIKARVPQLNNKLDELASSLSEKLDSGNGMTVSVRKVLGDIEVTLKSLEGKVEGSLKKSIKKLLKQIRVTDCKRNTIQAISSRLNIGKKTLSDEEILGDIHIELYKIQKECSEMLKDSQWEQ